mmetsp:Transcript_4654/g.17507  ORF Transcript_4654/g.17507 Transcript_4654/m.17507 type:complete len:212 (-) Transcript_4654:598-1233(-)
MKVRFLVGALEGDQNVALADADVVDVSQIGHGDIHHDLHRRRRLHQEEGHREQDDVAEQRVREKGYWETGVLAGRRERHHLKAIRQAVLRIEDFAPPLRALEGAPEASAAVRGEQHPQLHNHHAHSPKRVLVRGGLPPSLSLLLLRHLFLVILLQGQKVEPCEEELAQEGENDTIGAAIKVLVDACGNEVKRRLSRICGRLLTSLGHCRSF